jgi:probable phosphoglycerate mutase
MRLVLVRHGETAWSRSGRHTGRTDLPLLATGHRHAELLAARLRPLSFSMVRTSPLARARETCALAGFGEQMILDDDLMEWDYGAYEGRTTDEIHAERPGWNLFRDGCPHGEAFPDVSARVERVIERVVGVDGDTAIFAHGHLLRTFAARWLGMGSEVAAALALSPATVSMLGHERDTPVISLWNDDGHLEET